MSASDIDHIIGICRGRPVASEVQGTRAKVSETQESCLQRFRQASGMVLLPEGLRMGCRGELNLRPCCEGLEDKTWQTYHILHEFTPRSRRAARGASDFVDALFPVGRTVPV